LLLAYIKSAATGLLSVLKGILAAIGAGGLVLTAVGAALVLTLKWGFNELHKAQNQEFKVTLQAAKAQDQLKNTIKKQIEAEVAKGNIQGVYKVAADARRFAISKDAQTTVQAAFRELNVKDAVNQWFLRQVFEQHGVAKSDKELEDALYEIVEALHNIKYNIGEQVKETQKMARNDEKEAEEANKRDTMKRLLELYGFRPSGER
jgi:hypothetical protein